MNGTHRVFDIVQRKMCDVYLQIFRTDTTRYCGVIIVLIIIRENHLHISVVKIFLGVIFLINLAKGSEGRCN